MKIIELDVHSYGGQQLYRVGLDGVKEIWRNERRDGYDINYNNGDRKELTGYFNYIATIDRKKR